MRRYELREDQWLRIALLLPGKEGDRGRSGEDNRKFVHAVLWIARSGAPWRDLPERFGNWNGSPSDSVFQRFNRWAKKGVWQQVFEVLQEPDRTANRLDWILADSTIIRAHRAANRQHAAGQKKVQTAR
jgi:transposase